MKNQVLIIDTVLGENLQYRLQNEGIHVYWQQPLLYDSDVSEEPYFLGQGLNNFVFGGGKIEKVGQNWTPYLDKVDFIVFTDVGMNEIQNHLRKDGYKVINGGDTEFLEINRSVLKDFYKKLYSGTGTVVLPRYWKFKNSNEQQEFVNEKKIGVVFKTDTELQHNEKYSTRVIKDPVQQYHYIRSLNIKNVDIILEEYIDGWEIQIGGFFNGKTFMNPLNYNVEDKTLLPWDYAPLTGEMGTTVWYFEKDTRFYNEILKPIETLLKEFNYVGYFDLNCIYSPERDRIYILEQTQRFGYPLSLIQQNLHKVGWFELFNLMLDGKNEFPQLTGFPEITVEGTDNTIQVGVCSNSEGYPYNCVLEKLQHQMIPALDVYLKEKVKRIVNEGKLYPLMNTDGMFRKYMNNQIIDLFGVYFDEEDKIFRTNPMTGRLFVMTGLSKNQKIEEQLTIQLEERLTSGIYVFNELMRDDIGIWKTKNFKWEILFEKVFNIS